MFPSPYLLLKGLQYRVVLQQGVYPTSDYMDFRKKLVNDRDFAAKFKDCHTVEDLVAAAGREGFRFTAEEVRNNTELLPEELMTAAGGINVANAFNPERKIVDW